MPARIRPTSWRTGFWRCEVPSTAAPGPTTYCSCSGRTREGPEPKRPSRGLSSSGILRSGVVWVMWPGGDGGRIRDAQSGQALLLEVCVDPVHLRAQLLPHDLDLVAGLLGAHALEVLLARAVLGNPLTGEVPALDLLEDLL